MTINNLEYSPSSTVRQWFYPYIPFGSDYVIYTSQYGSGTGYTRKYDLLVHKLGKSDYQHYQITQTNNGYSFQKLSDGDYSGFTTSYPVNAYSNVAGVGLEEQTLPCVNNTICFMLIVLASLAVLKTVFGGIVKLWRNRAKDVYA